MAYTGYKLVEMANERGYLLSYHPIGQSYVNYFNYKYSDMYLKSSTEKENTNIEESKEKEKKPPYSGEELGSDPTKCPGEGFEWRGKG